MAFHDIRMPVDIERGAQGGPQFKTSILGFGTGTEQRNQEWANARGVWDVAYGVQNKADYSSLIDFFTARRGMLHGFRFKDWSDFEATLVLLGTGDGIELDYQIVKTYGDAQSTYTRNITRPIASTILVYVNAVLQTITTDYTITAKGFITFVVAPPSMEDVTCTFEFDVPCRFDMDHLELEVEWYNAAELPDITIIEIRETLDT